jgi:PAS domain S-box-containing protein
VTTTETRKTSGQKQANAEIERLNEELEQPVGERTNQLTAVDNELTKEVLQRERAEKALLRSEAYLAEAQRVSHTGSFGWSVSSGDIVWSEETFRILGCDPARKPTVEVILERTHPEDRALVQETLHQATEKKRPFDVEHRLLMPDGSVKYIRVVGHPSTHEDSGDVEFVGAVTDVTAAKKAEQKLREKEAYLSEAQRLTHTGSGAWRVPGWEPLYLSEEWYRIYGFDPKQGLSAWKDRLQRMHPDDRAKVQEAKDRAVSGKSDYEVEHRIILPDGTVKYTLTVGHPVLNASGDVEQFVCTMMDITRRKLTEEALRRSEAYLAEAQRLSHTGSWAGTLRELRYWSEECYRVLGFDPHQGLPPVEIFFQRFHPDDRTRSIAEFAKAAREKTGFEFDYRIVHPGGEIRDIHTIGHPVFSPAGDLAEFVGTMIDVTERKRAEALRNGESQVLEMIARDHPLEKILEKLVEVTEAQFSGLICSVLLLDEDGQHVRHGAGPSLPNDYIKAIDGLRIGPKAGSCGTAMYRKESVVVTDILQDPLWEPYREVAKVSGLRACWSTPILAHSGKVLGSFAMYYREPRGPIPPETHALELATHLAGIAIERKRTHDQLQRSEAYLSEAQRLSHTGSWAFNAREAVYWSEENFRIWGFNPEQGLPDRETVLRRIHPQDRSRVLECVQKAVRERTDYAVEFRIVLPDGTVKHVHGLGHPVFSASGEFVEVVGTQLDVTERKRVEAERERLQELQADLAHVNRVTTMGELTASLAHEIKQPITAALTDAKTCSRWLRPEQPDLAEASEAASRIVTAVTRAAEIISRINLLFKKGALQRELVDVNELIREMIVLLHNEAARYSISIRSDLAESLPKVMADRIQLQQVFLNLMLNGIESMKDLGTPGELTIMSQQDEGSQLLVSIGDTGVGLQPGEAAKVFDAFYTTKNQGTGMGLPISRSIIESHGGRLWVTPNFGRGTVFQFTFPSEVKHDGA